MVDVKREGMKNIIPIAKATSERPASGKVSSLIPAYSEVALASGVKNG